MYYLDTCGSSLFGDFEFQIVMSTSYQGCPNLPENLQFGGISLSHGTAKMAVGATRMLSQFTLRMGKKGGRGRKEMKDSERAVGRPQRHNVPTIVYSSEGSQRGVVPEVQ